MVRGSMQPPSHSYGQIQLLDQSDIGVIRVLTSTTLAKIGKTAINPVHISY